MKKVRGINILNPVDVDREYYLKAIDFAIENGYNHIQLNGPIHDFKRCNVDGMMFYKKYAEFNCEKDADYVNYCIDVVNEALEKSNKAGIKTYMWHHELDVPSDFMARYPEILNDSGDVEITHPLIKDFLENKLKDFYETYPLMDGLVITFYETKIPLLRLKNQKLGQQERMEYITNILYETSKSMGKELVVRTDATLEEDYKVLLDTYVKVSTDMMIMDKWTQYDWSLSLPSNQFIKNVTRSPLLIETDIFGEYFGKGRLPLMLKKHIKENFDFCEQFNPIGYCSRIDRGGQYCFGQVNEVNLHIMKACLDGGDVNEVVNKFFNDKYGKASDKVLSIMEKTEDVVRKTLFAGSYYYSELSLFPSLNHCKNHFYFEQMKTNGKVVSNEWFVPKDYQVKDPDVIFSDLKYAKDCARKLLEQILKLKDEIEEQKYKELFVKFKNLQLVTEAWSCLAEVFYNYVKYFEQREEKYKDYLFSALQNLIKIDEQGMSALGDEFICHVSEVAGKKGPSRNRILEFVQDVKQSFNYETKIVNGLEKDNPIDFIVCGGGNEGHELKKEVNFSDTLFLDGELVRIPGNKKGLDWSLINAHGWFSYSLKVKPNAKNIIKLVVGGKTDKVNFKVTIADKEYFINQDNKGKNVIILKYKTRQDENSVRIQIDKISGHTPCIYTIETLQ
ncbi:MAG: hypothetical protein E7346_05600 [Clostridiales bacterium]|nr:hypothetical protein [Clostridiales bacterium]